MNTLIAYATKYGCTEKCAGILAEKLIGKVDLCDLRKETDIDLSKYDKVIVGGSVYVGKVRKEVAEFCSKNFNILKKKDLGLFVCGMLEDQAEEELTNSFPPQLLEKALAKGFFGGELQLKKMKLSEKFIVRMVSRVEKSSPALDMSKDVSTISEETINGFSALMNNP